MNDTDIKQNEKTETYIYEKEAIHTVSNLLNQILKTVPLQNMDNVLYFSEALKILLNPISNGEYVPQDND